MTTHRAIDGYFRCAVLAVLLLGGSVAGGSPAELARASDGLEVVCRDAEGAPLPVVTVSLCPASESSSDCLIAFSDDAGRAVFRGVAPGSYLLRASQDGWADTVVGPLNIGGASPKAPGEIFVVMNPVFFDCL